MVFDAAHLPATHSRAPFSAWFPADESVLVFDPESLAGLAQRPRECVHVITDASRSMIGAAMGGVVAPSFHETDYHLLGTLPALYPEWLGDRAFAESHQVRFPITASGIGDTFVVVSLAEAGMLSFYETAGRSRERIAHDIGELVRSFVMRTNWGVTFHHHDETDDDLANLFAKDDVPHIALRSFPSPTPPVVRLAVIGIHTGRDGNLHRRTHLNVTVDDIATAEAFMTPADAELLDQLVNDGHISHYEAELARRMAIVEDITVAGDALLFADAQRLEQRLRKEYMYARPIRIGIAGATETPRDVSRAFAQGASYVEGNPTDHSSPAFQQWIKGSFLDHTAHATAVNIVRNLLEGAAVMTRAQQLRSSGLPVGSNAFTFVPRELS